MSEHLKRAQERTALAYAFDVPKPQKLWQAKMNNVRGNGPAIKLYEQLIKLNGEDHQRSVAVGELGELINELSKFLRHKGVNMRLCEELADVEIVLEQLKLMHDPENVRVPLFKRFKLARLSEFNVKGGEK